MLSNYVRTHSKQCSIRFRWNLRAARIRRLAPPQAPGLSRRCFLSFCRALALSPLVPTPSAFVILTTGRLGHSTFRTRTDKVHMTPSQSSLQLSLFLDDLRGFPPVIEGHGCSCRYRHPATAASLPRSKGHPAYLLEPSFDRRFRNSLPQSYGANFALCDICIDAATSLMDDFFHGFSMDRCDFLRHSFLPRSREIPI